MSERIQRRRTSGWRLPEGAVVVDRTASAWGNPYRVGTPWNDYPAARGNQDAVDRYVQWARAGGQQFLDVVRRQLAGKDLACWCKTTEPCHADVLLRIAAGGEP